MYGRWCLAVAAFLVLVADEGRAIRGRLIEHGFQALGGFQAQDVHVDGQTADRVEEQCKRGEIMILCCGLTYYRGISSFFRDNGLFGRSHQIRQIALVIAQTGEQGGDLHTVGGQ